MLFEIVYIKKVFIDLCLKNLNDLIVSQEKQTYFVDREEIVMFNLSVITMTSKFTVYSSIFLLQFGVCLCLMFFCCTTMGVGVQLSHNLKWIKYLQICLQPCIYVVNYGLQGINKLSTFLSHLITNFSALSHLEALHAP